jgi:hypothetical protein
VSEAAPPGPELIERLAEEVRRNEFGIGPIVEVILRSKHFYSRAAYCQRIKSPVEFSAGLVRTLEVPRPALDPLALAAACDAQGQELFAPPNVEGWVGGPVWINSSTAAPCWSAPSGPRMLSEAYPRTDRRRSTRATGPPATTSPLSAPPGRCWTCCSRTTSEMRPAGWRSMPGETAARAISARRSSAWPTAPNSNRVDPHPKGFAMHPTRREMLRLSLGSSALLACGPPVPLFLARSAGALAGDRASSKGGILVGVQLDGGNDGLNTVVPYRDAEFRRRRPRLAILSAEVKKVDDRVGLHPSLDEFAKLLEQQRLAIVQGVGYPNPNRSHFESMAIWHTARTEVGMQRNPVKLSDEELRGILEASL